MFNRAQKAIRSLDRSDYCKLSPSINQDVYFLLTNYLVCSAKVTSIDFVLYSNDSNLNKLNPSVWFYLNPKMKDGYLLLIPTGEKNKQGWPITREGSLNELVKYKIINWFVDIDLPVGHSETCNEEGDRIFTNLSKAIEQLKPCKAKKKYKASVLHNYISEGKKFIANTNRKLVKVMSWPNYPRYEERKVYNRKK